MKKIKIPKFLKTQLKSDSESDLDSDLEKIEVKIDNELEPGSDSEYSFFSSNIHEVIRSVLNIFYDKISQAQKSIKKNTRH